MPQESVFLAGEVEDHGSVFVVFAPGPGFRDVIGVVEMKDEMMLVARGRRRQVSRALIVEAELFRVIGRRNDSHSRLIVGGAIEETQER